MEDTTDGGRKEDGGPTVHRVQFDPETDDIAERIIYAVASIRGVEPEQLVPLRTAIDPDALNALFDPSGSESGLAEGRLVFAYEGIEITVTSDGEIRLRPMNDLY